MGQARHCNWDRPSLDPLIILIEVQVTCLKCGMETAWNLYCAGAAEKIVRTDSCDVQAKTRAEETTGMEGTSVATAPVIC